MGGFLADIESSQDYYPFGMLQPGRQWNTTSYRFGFNGKENDNEVKGIGNSVDFGARIYDSRLGRWMACDPKSAKYPSISPYAFVANSPIIAIDPNGEEIAVTSETNEETGKTTITITVSGIITFDKLSNPVSSSSREKYVKNLNEALVSTYSKSFGDVDVVFVSNLVLGSETDIKPEDHVVYVTNLHTGEATIPEENVGGFANFYGGKVAYFPKSPSFHTAAHEFGHLLGLLHPFDLMRDYKGNTDAINSFFPGLTLDFIKDQMSWDNIMEYYDEYNTTGGWNFDKYQAYAIKYMYDQGYLNLGTNEYNLSCSSYGASTAKVAAYKALQQISEEKPKTTE